MRMPEQEQIMREHGYITASEAMRALGVGNIGTVHRMLMNGRVAGAKLGAHWYVNVKSLIEAHADAPPLCERILSIGVEPKDPLPKFQVPAKGEATKKAMARAKRRA